MVRFFCRKKDVDRNNVIQRNLAAFKIVEDGNGWFVYDTEQDYLDSACYRLCHAEGLNVTPVAGHPTEPFPTAEK